MTRLLLQYIVANEKKILGRTSREGLRVILALEPDLTLSTQPRQRPQWRNVSPWWM